MTTIIKDKNLSVSARLLLLYLNENQESGEVDKDKKLMAAELGVKRESIIRWVNELKDLGYVEEQRLLINKPSKIRILK